MTSSLPVKVLSREKGMLWVGWTFPLPLPRLTNQSCHQPCLKKRLTFDHGHMEVVPLAKARAVANIQLACKHVLESHGAASGTLMAR